MYIIDSMQTCVSACVRVMSANFIFSLKTGIRVDVHLLDMFIKACLSNWFHVLKNYSIEIAVKLCVLVCCMGYHCHTHTHFFIC